MIDDENSIDEDFDIKITHKTKPYLMVPCPKGVTNGQMIKYIFKDRDYSIIEQRLNHTMWWDKPYKG